MDQADLFRLASDALGRAQIVHAFTGGHASAAYGENRFVNDIDVVVPVGQLTAAWTSLAACTTPALRVGDASGGRFTLLHDDSSQRVDVIVAADPPWPDGLLRRRRLAVPDGRPAWFVSPEDLILYKMGAYQRGALDTHLRDVASVLRITGDSVDRAYVDGWAGRLGLTAIWEQIVMAVGSRGREPVGRRARARGSV